MTASKTICAAINHLRRTIARTLRRVAFKSASATLTLSFPPFVKLEIKTETAAAKRVHRRKSQHKPA